MHVMQFYNFFQIKFMEVGNQKKLFRSNVFLILIEKMAVEINLSRITKNSAADSKIAFSVK